MSEYLVRWKFSANSFLNNRGHDSRWYQQIHQDKPNAVKHYANLKYDGSDLGIEVELFQLVKLLLGKQELIVDEDVKEEPAVSETRANKAEEINKARVHRNNQVMKLRQAGHSNKEISDKMNIHLSTVYSIVNRHKIQGENNG